MPTVHVHAFGDGSFGVAFAAAVSGASFMSVTLGKEHVTGSPFYLTVGPSFAWAEGPAG